MKTYSVVLFAILLLFPIVHAHNQFTEKLIVVVVASYNNEQWYQRNLDSIFMQHYDNYHVIYIDDASSDDTGTLVEHYINEHGYQDRCTLVKNEKHLGRHLENQYNAIYSVPDNAIIVICDGDDWLAHEHVFERVNAEYQAGAWMTHGQFWYWKKDRVGISRQIPLEVLQAGTVRQLRPWGKWGISHLRTFYAGLFKQIKKEDLMHEGQFLPMCADVSTMIPMVEMAGRHAHFIPDILYIYNDGNSLNFFHNHREEQLFFENEIRNKTPYKQLDEMPF